MQNAREAFSRQSISNQRVNNTLNVDTSIGIRNSVTQKVNSGGQQPNLNRKSKLSNKNEEDQDNEDEEGDE
jgi:hypothetical protein